MTIVNAENFEIIHQSLCLKYRIICGILINKATRIICVYGEKAFNICSLNTECNEITQISENLHEVDDLIWTVDWVNDESVDKLALVCAHNQMIVYNLKDRFIERCVCCVQKCLIYSAKVLYFKGLDEMYIASGTIYNKILIWDSNSGSIVCTLEGHQGVIFSIGFDRKYNYLYSVSDDRSVIVWKLDPVNSISIEGKLSSRFFGHEARVWKCIWFETVKRGAFLCSIGEDLKCCIWSLNENRLFYRFNTIRKGSKNIWSVCIDESNYNLITGWQDGGLRKYELKWHLGLNDNESEKMNSNLNELKLEFEKDYIRTVELIDDTIIFCTNNGHIYTVASDGRKKCILKDQNLKGYNCMAKDENGYVAIGTYNGKIFLIEKSEIRTCFNSCEIELKTDNLFKEDKFANKFKIFSLIWGHHANTNDLYLLASFKFLNGLLHLYCFNEEKFDLVLKSRLILSDSKNQWATCFSITNNFIFIGDKCGNLSFYKNDQNLTLKSPIQTIASKQSSSINRLYSKPLNQLIYCSNDGFYYLFKVTESETLQLVNKYEINSSIDLIQELIFDDAFEATDDISFDIENNLLLALCFYGDKFILWSFQMNRIIAEICCGGANRSWSYELKKLNDTDYLFRFIFLKQKSVHEFSKRFHVNELGLSCRGKVKVNHLMQVFHGNNISSCLFLNKKYLLTGSEDTQVIVTRIEKNLTHSHHLQGHDSVIKCMCIRYLDKYSKLLLTAGGKANMKLWKIVVNEEENIEQIVQVCEFKRFTKTKRQAVDAESNPDIRFMHCDIYSIDCFEFFMYFACSDGHVRIFKYNLNAKRISLIDSCQYNRCLLCLKTLCINERLYIICTSTDGNLVFYKLENQVFSSDKKPIKIISSIHQSGINSFDVWHEDEIYIASVGDDAVLSILNLKFNKDESIEYDLLIRLDMAHASSIMGKISFLALFLSFCITNNAFT